jgi:hypothetical protein
MPAGIVHLGGSWRARDRENFRSPRENPRWIPSVSILFGHFEQLVLAQEMRFRRTKGGRTLASQTHCTIDMPLSGAGHHAVLHAVLASDGGWDVTVERDRSIVMQRHCRDWHRVERLHARIERLSRQAADPYQLTDSPAA